MSIFEAYIRMFRRLIVVILCFPHVVKSFLSTYRFVLMRFGLFIPIMRRQVFFLLFRFICEYLFVFQTILRTF